MKPMTTEEIDAIEAAWCKGRCIIRGNSSDTPDIDIQRLIATARLAPQWRKGSERPVVGKVVWTGKYMMGFAGDSWFTVPGNGKSYRSNPPDLWCELPTPPSEQEGGR